MSHPVVRILPLVAVLAIGIGFGALCLGGPTPPEPVVTSASSAPWTCAMHPQIQADGPGDCPLCGMALIQPATADTSDVTRVVLSERARALARLRTTAVTRLADASARIRLLGRVEPDETTRKTVTTWVDGRIDRLHVNTTGQTIRKGQIIATVYSPGVYAAHQDLLAARDQLARLQSGSDGARLAAAAAVQAARDRLSLVGVSPEQLAVLEAADQPTRALPIHSPFSGTVIERVATEGAYVTVGSPLYRVADLDRLWVQLDAYESDLPRLKPGQLVRLSVEGLEEPIDGTISFIDPTVDLQRRVARVRVALPYSDDRLRAGMFVEAVVAAPASASAPLVVPATAPLFTGKRSIVYVESETAAGLAYSPRTVRLGPKLGDHYPVVAGLSEGERVVSRGAFAIDADLQIRGGNSMMASDDDEADGPWDGVVQITDTQRSTLAPTVSSYLAVQRALAEDDHAATVAAATQLLTDVDIELPGSARQPWNSLVDRIRTRAVQISSSTDLEGARGGFEPLSAAVADLLRTFGNPLDVEVHLAHCPMANSNRGASWVQTGDTIDNAYFGASMRTCGDLTADVEPGGYLPTDLDVRAGPAHAGHDH